MLPAILSRPPCMLLAWLLPAMLPACLLVLAAWLLDLLR
jgi:hypothetical protein